MVAILEGQEDAHCGECTKKWGADPDHVALLGGDLSQLGNPLLRGRSFREGDPRFLRDGKHVALVQYEFDAKAVEQYCNVKIREVAKLRGPRLYRELERSFHLFDPDDD